jgi:hypothetical protein
MVRATFRYAALLAIVLVVGLVVFVAVTYPRFRADTQPNRERLLGGSDTVSTEEFGESNTPTRAGVCPCCSCTVPEVATIRVSS